MKVNRNQFYELRNDILLVTLSGKPTVLKVLKSIINFPSHEFNAPERKHKAGCPSIYNAVKSFFPKNHFSTFFSTHQISFPRRSLLRWGGGTF